MVLTDFNIAKLQKQLKTMTLFTFLLKMIPKPYKTIYFIYFCDENDTKTIQNNLLY